LKTNLGSYSPFNILEIENTSENIWGTKMSSTSIWLVFLKGSRSFSVFVSFFLEVKSLNKKSFIIDSFLKII